MNITDLRQSLIRKVALITTAEQFQGAAAYLNSLSDAAIVEFAAKHTGKKNNLSLREQILGIEAIKNKNGVTTENDALIFTSVTYMSDKENKAFLARIGETSPTDVIQLTREADLTLIDLWRKSGGHTKGTAGFIPSDLFFAKTVPLMDCRIVVDERAAFDVGVINTFRVVVFDDYSAIVDATTENSTSVVGALILESVIKSCGGHGFIVPLVVVGGVDGLISADLGWTLNAKNFLNRVNKLTVKELSDMFVEHLSTWYGIQIALLHPLVKEVFNAPKFVKNNVKDVIKTGNERTRPVKYIKTHVINAADVDNCLYGTSDVNEAGEKRAITRKALAWWVIGHHRLQNGKKIFVQGYWKGPLRNLRQAATPREREIAQLQE
jgi:hypothetical protein